MKTYKMSEVNPKYRETIKTMLSSVCTEWSDLEEVDDYQLSFCGLIWFADDLLVKEEK